ncbi:MAG: GAF domain-containing protein [Deltaproteobacteria bacterium]|nr:GAF domain-containing protein [Deltaproteobacteria bacterium]
MFDNVNDFPFKSVLSFSGLIDFWRQLLSKRGGVEDAIMKAIENELNNAPEMFEPITDFKVLEKNRSLIDMLMSLVFPPAFNEQDYAAAFVPFQSGTVYVSPRFKRLWPSDSCVDFEHLTNLNAEQWAMGRLYKACSLILETFYDMRFPHDFPLIVTIQDPETHLDRFLNISFDPRFVEILKTGKLKPLSNADREWILSAGDDPVRWMEILPPDRFLFQGFGVCRAVDVTDQEVLSSLKRDLIEKESIFSSEGFSKLHEKLCIYLGQPDLIMDLAAFQGEEVLILNPDHKMDHECETGCIFADSDHRMKEDFRDSIFVDVVEKGEHRMIRDLQKYPKKSPLELHMIEKGVRSIFVAPLYYQERILGTFSVKSPHPEAFSMLDVMKLQDITPLFSMAINRGMEELNHRVQAIIKEKCTAIHPSVEWRFNRAALNYMAEDRETVTELEPILFPNVYPLYGVSDIRDSSDYRNTALQSDLVEQFKMVQEIILLAQEKKPLPILDALNYRIQRNIEEVQDSLNSGDEVASAEFIRKEIEPVLDHLMEADSGMREPIETYRAALEPSMGAFYKKRKDFEESIFRINEAISVYLNEEEETAQDFFPHYFEMMKTDGVDYTIYIGASMVEDLKFDMLYLKNLRLWQLMVMCGVAWRTEDLKATSKMPLEAAHLILVQDTPLSIRFRPDERRFDVDGAYDIRHEIIKKRIDKARIKGSGERLTQPGKIAIVYSHGREMREYLKYIDYLQEENYLEKEIEKVELENLQGVYGLHALRVTVNMTAARKRPFVAPESVRQGVKTL